MIDCTICKDTKNEPFIIITVCGHAYHKSCLEEWSRDHDTCPLCRETFTSENLVKIRCDFINSSQSNSSEDQNDRINVELVEARSEIELMRDKLIESEELGRENVVVLNRVLSQTTHDFEEIKRMEESYILQIQFFKDQTTELNSEIELLKTNLNEYEEELLKTKSELEIMEAKLRESEEREKEKSEILDRVLSQASDDMSERKEMEEGYIEQIEVYKGEIDDLNTKISWLEAALDLK